MVSDDRPLAPASHYSLRSRTPITEWVNFRRFKWLYHSGQVLGWFWQRKTLSTCLFLGFWAFASTGSWLAFAGAIMLVGGLGFWVRYEFVRRQHGSADVKEIAAAMARRGTLNRQWPKACKAAGLRYLPKLHSLRITHSGGYTAHITPGKIGVPISDMTKRLGDMAEIVGCREIVLTPIEAKPGQAKIEFHWNDAIGRGLSLDGLPVAPKGQFAYGVRADGSPAGIHRHLSALIGGETGSGKSNVIHTLIADAVRQRIPLRLYVSDPKGGLELDAYEDRVGKPGPTLEVRKYATSPAETVRMIESLEQAMHARQAAMKARGQRKHVPTDEDPLVVLVLDELLLLAEMLKKGADSPLGRLLFTGRAVGYVVWACTQIGQVDALGRARDFFPQRICLRTPRHEVTDSVLRPGAEAEGAKCSALTKPGVGYSYSEGERKPARFRVPLVHDHEVKMIARGEVPMDMPMEGVERLHALYTWYDADGYKRYIGETGDIFRRTAEHEETKKWMREVVRGDVLWLPDAATAKRVEAEMIKEESAKPDNRLENIAHAGNGRWRRPWVGPAVGRASSAVEEQAEAS